MEAAVGTVEKASDATKEAVGVAEQPRVVQGAALAALGAAQLVGGWRPSLAACRQHTVVAVSPSLGVSQRAWV